MKAVVVSELGQIPEATDVPDAVRGDGESLLEVLAAPINPVDLGVASGAFFAGSPPVPYIAGAEGIGRILESATHQPGTVVWTGMQGLGVSRNGCMGERVAARDGLLIPVPDGADPAIAGACGIAGISAWLPLTWRAPVRDGETVLVLGATGVLGSVAVQAAKLLGAGRVVAAGRRPAKLARAAELGADATVELDAHDDLVTAFRDACGGDGPNLVIDPLWGAPLVAAVQAAAPFARVVQIGQSAGAEATIPSGAIRGKSLDLLGYTTLAVPVDVLTTGFRELVEHATAGRIQIEVERVSLDGAPDAWLRQAGGADTKFVVCP